MPAAGCARRGWRPPAKDFVDEGFRAFFAFIAAEPDTFAFLERNKEAVLPLALGELERGPRRTPARRASTSSYMRARDGRRRAGDRGADARPRAAGC